MWLRGYTPYTDRNSSTSPSFLTPTAVSKGYKIQAIIKGYSNYCRSRQFNVPYAERLQKNTLFLSRSGGNVIHEHFKIYNLFSCKDQKNSGWSLSPYLSMMVQMLWLKYMSSHQHCLSPELIGIVFKISNALSHRQRW